MRLTLLWTTVCCSILFTDCASTTSTSHNRERILHIKSWQIVYSSRVDPNTAPTYQSERVRKSGQVKSELQFPESVFSGLKNRFNLPVTNDTSQVRAQIRLQAMIFASGGFKYLDVALYDTNNQLLAETRVWNEGERQNSFTYNDSFAEYAADKIAEFFGIQ